MANNVSVVSELRTVNELWWIGAIQGTLAIFFGISAIFWPALTLVTLVYLFSAFVLSLGIVEVVHGLISIRARSTWWVTLLIGLISLGVGVYLMRHPDISFGTFILLAGLALIARGLLDVVRAFIDKNTTTNKALMIAAGVLAIVAGIVILMQPLAGGIAFVWVIGLYAIIFGTIILAMSFELHHELEALMDNVSAKSGAKQ